MLATEAQSRAEESYRAPLEASFNWRRLFMWLALVMMLMRASMVAKLCLVAGLYMALPLVRAILHPDLSNSSVFFDMRKAAESKNWIATFRVHQVGLLSLVLITGYYLYYRLIDIHIDIPTLEIYRYFYASDRIMNQINLRATHEFGLASANVVAVLIILSIIFVLLNDLLMPIDFLEFRLPRSADAMNRVKKRKGDVILAVLFLAMLAAISFAFDINSPHGNQQAADIQRHPWSVIIWCLMVYAIYLLGVAWRTLIAWFNA